MNIPNKVKVGAIWYDVEEKDNTENWGTVNFLKQTIALRKDLSHQQKEMTFIHELLHAVVSDRALDAKVTEEMVETLGYGLYALFIENKIF